VKIEFDTSQTRSSILIHYTANVRDQNQSIPLSKLTLTNVTFREVLYALPSSETIPSTGT